ncbi:MAG: bleomycin resistance protein [Myxococcales bacterium]|nr:bleomycin resistance protein [Myxococcales bacterium]
MLPRGAINHLDLTVVDPEASAPFYEAVLGHLGYERVRVAGDDTPMWQHGAPGQQPFTIALQRASADGAKRPHDRRAPGLHHLAFHATSRAEVDALHTLLVERGERVRDAPAVYPDYAPGYYAVFFSDPDGLKLELVHMPEPPILE